MHISKKQTPEVWLKAYSKTFVFFSFAFLLFQLLGSNLTVTTISDSFLLRMELIREFNRARYFLGDRIFNEGIVGKDGWLFYSGDFSIHDYQKTSPVSKKNLKGIENILNILNESTTKNGGAFLVVIPPDKNTIYPQYMPDQIPVLGRTSRLDQLLDYMHANTKVPVMDLRPVLIGIGKSSAIYYKSDAHWNCLGAFYASSEIISQLHIHGLLPHSLSDFEIGTAMDSTLDIAGTMGLGLQEETWTLTPKFVTNLEVKPASFLGNRSMRLAINTRKDLPTAVILHDSFYSECLNQFLEPYFSRTVSMHYATATLDDYVNLINDEKPDIVLVEFAERHIEYFYKLLKPTN